MILHASSPDGIAAQQLQYDQLYNGNNQNNASRYDAAQARALQAMLSQRESDQRAQDAADTSAEQANQFNQRLAFQGEQGALDRASRERDVKTQYDSTHADRQDALNSKDFEQAQKLAMVGQTPQTEDKLKLQYPKFDANQIKVLANASAQYGLSKFQNAFHQSMQVGQPLPIEAIKNYVSPESPFYQDAVDHRSSSLAGPQALYDASAEKVRKGNLATRIQEDISAPPLDTSLGFGDFIRAPISSTAFALKNLVLPSVPASSVIQPSGNWQSRAPQIVSALQAGNDPSVTTDVTTGKFIPAYQNLNAPVAMPILPPQPAPSSTVPTVTSQAQFDLLPSGTIYIGKGGKQFRKP